VGEDTWNSTEKGSEFPHLTLNPGTYREKWKTSLKSTLAANMTFLTWIFEQLAPARKAVADMIDMTADTVMTFGDAEVGCNYKKRITVPVPAPKYFIRGEDDGKGGSVFIPIFEEPVREQTVHVLSGDYFKSIDVILKKTKQLRGRLFYLDPPWGFHASKPGSLRKEDEFLEPPDRVSRLLLKICLLEELYLKNHLMFSGLPLS